MELCLRHLREGRLGQLPSVEQAFAYDYSPEERQFIEHNRDRVFIGSPATVQEQLTGLAERAGVTEIMVTTLMHRHGDRRLSYELLAEAFRSQVKEARITIDSDCRKLEFSAALKSKPAYCLGEVAEMPRFVL